MKTVGILLLLLATVAVSEVTSNLLTNLQDFDFTSIVNVQNRNANDDIDFVLRTFKGVLPSRVKLGDLRGDLAHDCYLTGLGSGINRDGNAILDISDKKAVFSFGLSTNKITVECRWKRKVVFVRFRGTVKASTNKVSIRAKLSLDLVPGAHPKLDEFKVSRLDRIKTDVKGIGPLNSLAELILNGMANRARGKMVSELEDKVPKKLQPQLNKLKLPSI